MVNSSRPRKSTTNAGKNESSGPGESSGLRRSTRETPSKNKNNNNNNSSPVSVRKSQRLDNKGAQNPPATTSPVAKKKIETQSQNPSPLRRSGRENKFQSPSSKLLEKFSTFKGGMKQNKEKEKGLSGESSKDKKKDQSLKEIAEEVKGKEATDESTKVGTKRKKRLDARSYREMFKPLKKMVKVPESSKRARPENCDDSDVSENEEEGQEEGNVGEELKEDCTDDVNGDTKVSDAAGAGNDDVRIEKPSESEDGKSLHVSVSGDMPSSSPGTKVKKSEAVDLEMDRSGMETSHDQEKHLAKNQLSDDGNGVRCDPKGTTSEAPAANERTLTNIEDALPSVSSRCKMSLLTDQCTKCLRKRRLDYNSPRQELCCCFSNSTSDTDMISVSKDRGEGGSYVTAQFTGKDGQDMQHCDPTSNLEQSTCVKCKRAGKLLHCGGAGCKRSYHASCLLTPEIDLLLPIWYCFECNKKRLTHGVHSVSEGVESIVDFREVEISNSKGVEKQKQYFVKYKGLAHIHNHWVSEIHLLDEAPEILAEFGRKIEFMLDWVVPHRLLRKRSLITDDHPYKHIDQDAGVVLNGQCECLVKWCGLDYDQATWELEDSSCLKTPDVLRLIKEHETRLDRARVTALSRGNECQERRKGSNVKLGRLSGGCLSGADSFYLNSVNKLREYHNKGHNAVLLGEQDRIVKVIHLVSSLLSSFYQPFLIITPYESLSFWEAEFLRIAASVNVVAYRGSTNARKIIRSSEFYGEGGNMMLQVLLSSIEVISEDLEVFKAIEWEAVIVDECQQSCIWAHSDAVKALATQWRLLLVNAQLKDNVAEYINMLSLLDSGGNNQNPELMVDSRENINILKERLSSYIVCARFLEYWVPVQISNLQLEQYCSLILSKITALCSCSKIDPVGSLREILISMRKCCGHPYIVDPDLQTSLGKGLSAADLLDLGIKASGKLQLLDEILSKLRNQNMKVLILFQSIGGSARDTTGDILDDYLRQRFGKDSYEHIDGGCIASKKQAALTNFNRERERCFFLLEKRACLPTIKLSLVDAVIIYDSDWNPLNDLRSLQKITIDSKIEQIKVFRLYCACTVEEKVLIHAKNDMMLDSTLQGISPSTSHMLLMWGASYLFTKLDDFHRNYVSDSRGTFVPENSLVKDVSEEMLFLVQNLHCESNFISVARQNGGSYLKNTALIGEQKIQLEDGVSQRDYWAKLLEGKQPQWKYLSETSQRSRKRSHLDESTMLSEFQVDEAVKKRKKMDIAKVHSSSQRNGNAEKSDAADKDCQGAPGVKFNSDDRISLCTDQRDLSQILKPSILSLWEALLLKDEGKRLAEQLLEYVVKNHRIMREPDTVLQAFQISMCWAAADILNLKIDHKKSLAVAREKRNFSCTEDEAEYVYSKMKLPIKMFMLRQGLKSPKSSNDHSGANGISGGFKENDTEPEENDKQVLSPCNKEYDSLRHVKKVKKKCDKLMERLKDKQNNEVEKFSKDWDEERADLEKKYRVESAVIRSIHGKSSVGLDKLKILDDDFGKKLEGFDRRMSTCCKELEARHQAERDEQQKKIAQWLEQVKSFAQEELLDKPAYVHGGQLTTAENIESCKLSNGTSITTKHFQQDSDRETSMTPGPEAAPTISEVTRNKVNTVTSEMPSLVADKGRVHCQEDAARNFSEAVATTKEAGIIDVAADDSQLANVPEKQTNIGLSSAPTVGPVSESRDQEVSLEQHSAAPSREIEKDTNQMNAVELDTPTAFEASTTVICRSTEPLPSPSVPLTKELTADPASDGPLPMSQGLGDEPSRGLVDGAEGRAQQPTEMQNALPRGKTASLGHFYTLPSDVLLPDGLPGNEYPCPVSITTPSRDYHQAEVSASGRLDNECSEPHTSIRGTITGVQQEGNHANSSDEAVTQSMGLAVDHAIGTNLQCETRHASRPNPTQVPTSSTYRPPPLSHDPLRNELDRIRKDIDAATNMHEETILRLKTKRDKEIEEIVAQIYKRYDGKLKEAEASYLQKKNELGVNQEKVMMQRLLAKAFMSKCVDPKPASGVRPGTMEQFSQLQPATGTPTAVSNNHAVVPVWGHSSVALASSPTPRSHHMSPLAPNAGLQQVRSAIRAPTPHVPAFRSSSTPLSSTGNMASVSCGALGQPPPGNRLASSPAPPMPPQLPAAPLMALPNSQDQSQWHGSTLALKRPTREVLMEMARRNEENLASNVPLLLGNLRNLDSWDPSQFGTAPMLPPSSLGAVNDVVCLSDDE